MADAATAAATAPTLRDAEALVGLAYVPGYQDCMHLAVRAQRMLWGRRVAWQRVRHPVSRRLQLQLVQAGIGTVARPLADDEAPQAGDVVLWLAPVGDAQQYHLGTLFFHAGESWVLHTSAEIGASVLQRLTECPMWGLHLEGIYRWL